MTAGGSTSGISANIENAVAEYLRAEGIRPRTSIQLRDMAILLRKIYSGRT